MVPPKAWQLHETVGCKSIYEFLGLSADASLSDLRTAADKKYNSIHNQSSRNEVARAGTDLAGLCKSHILKDARSKREYDQELLARSQGNRADGPAAKRAGRDVAAVERRRARPFKDILTEQEMREVIDRVLRKAQDAVRHTRNAGLLERFDGPDHLTRNKYAQAFAGWVADQMIARGVNEEMFQALIEEGREVDSDNLRPGAGRRPLAW